MHIVRIECRRRIKFVRDAIISILSRTRSLSKGDLQLILLFFNESLISRTTIVQNIDSIQAIHFGMNYFVNVDIGLSYSMPLAIAHDIGMELQDQLETMDDIERVFVHLDYEYTHMPASEH